MSDDNSQNRGQQRADEARRTDDSELIEGMEGAPSFGGLNGHNINQDLATRDDLKQEVGDPSVTRARDSDKKNESNLPRYNESN